MKTNLSPAQLKSFQKPIAPLVSRTPTRPSLARQPRSLSRVGRGSHAAANAYRRRDALLRSFPEKPSRRRVARERADREVLKLWSGLGYYSRARNLHRAAKEIVHITAANSRARSTQLSHSPASAATQPRAVLSIAYDVPLAVLDGNVARVLARLAPFAAICASPARGGELTVTAQDLSLAIRPAIGIRP